MRGLPGRRLGGGLVRKGDHTPVSCAVTHMNSEPKRASQGAFDVTRMSEDDIADAIARQVDEIERKYGEPDESGAPMAEDGIAAQPEPLRDGWSSPYGADFSSLIAADDAESRVTRLLAMRLPHADTDAAGIVDEDDRSPAVSWRPSRPVLLGSVALVLLLSAGGWAALWKSQPPAAPSAIAVLTVSPVVAEKAAPALVRRQQPVAEMLPRSIDEQDAASLFYDTAAGPSAQESLAGNPPAGREPSPEIADGRVETLAEWPDLSLRERALLSPAPAAPMATETLPPTLTAEVPQAPPTPSKVELGETELGETELAETELAEITSGEAAPGSGLRNAARIPRIDQPAAVGAAGIGAPHAAIAALDPFLAPDEAAEPGQRLLLPTSAVIPGVPSPAPADAQGGTGRGAAGGAVLVKAADRRAFPKEGAAASDSAEEASSFETAAASVAAGGADAQVADGAPNSRNGSGKTKTGAKAAGKIGAKAAASGKGASKSNTGPGASDSTNVGGIAGALGGIAGALGGIGKHAADNAASTKDFGKASKESGGSTNAGKGNGAGGSNSGKAGNNGGGKGNGGKGGGNGGGNK